MAAPKRIVLSGAITGHEKEATQYFYEAERLVHARYPLASVFNPTRIPKQASWEDYMKICRARINGWADTIVMIQNEFYLDSRGAIEEKELAVEKGLKTIVLIANDTLLEVDHANILRNH